MCQGIIRTTLEVVLGSDLECPRRNPARVRWVASICKRQAKHFNNLDTKLITIKICRDIFRSKAFQKKRKKSYLIAKVAELNAVSVQITGEEESKQKKRQRCSRKDRPPPRPYPSHSTFESPKAGHCSSILASTGIRWYPNRERDLSTLRQMMKRYDTGSMALKRNFVCTSPV
jgi:hypothetical protein